MPNEQRMANAPAALNRIAPESSSLTRRIAAIIVSIWFGGILVIALGTPSAFRSVDNVLTSPPESVAKAVKALGPSLTREILSYQVSEANRLMFDIWGWAQVALAVAIVILLLFLSNVGRIALGLSLGMMFMAVLMNFALIPRLSETARLMRVSTKGPTAELAEQFRLIHYGFTFFELTVVALGVMLLVLLLRGRRGMGQHRRRVEEI